MAEMYIDSTEYNEQVHLTYVATSTAGSKLKRLNAMFQGWRKAKQIIAAGKADILHVHMAEKGSTFRKGMLVKYARRHNVKTIIHIHAGPFMEWYHTLSDGKKNHVRRYFESADRVIVLGNYWKKKMAELKPERDIKVIYNGINVPEHNLYCADSHNIIYMGRINEKKGIWDLLDAVKRINLSLPENTVFQIYGEDETGKLENRIAEMGLEKRVEIKGWIGEQEKQNAYLNAMIMVLPTYIEGLSMTVLESMAYGVPVITTGITTMPELLGGITDMIVPGDTEALAEKIVELGQDQSKRKEISRKEFEKVKKYFSKTEMISKTIEVYHELIP